ncbi:hypothetical protein ACUXCC_004258 [Cytobacillus horneckiae]
MYYYLLKVGDNMQKRTKKQTINTEELKFGLTTFFLHVSFYGVVLFILLLFLDLFSP